MREKTVIDLQFVQKAFLKHLYEHSLKRSSHSHEGIKLQVAGRIKNSRRKKKLTVVSGAISPSTLSKNLQYWEGRCHTFSGTIGLKLYKS